MRIDPEVDQRAARIAERSFGFLLPSQAAAVGHTRASLRSRTANGMLERRGRLYRFRGAPESWQGAVYEAVANATPGTVAGGLTAAALFGLCVPPRRPQLVVPRTGNARQDGATVIRSDLDRRDTTRIGIIPATTPARTLIDAAALLDHEHLCGLVDAAFVARLVAFHRIDAAIERTGAGPGRRGVASLRRAMRVWQPGMRHDSVPEARLFRLLETWGFALPEPLFRIHDGDGVFVCEVDAAWPDRLVALEYDSSLHHHERRWARDEMRAAAVGALGWAMVPVDTSDLRPGGHDRLRDRLAVLLAA